MFKALFYRFSLLIWFLKICHIGKYYFIIREIKAQMNMIKQMPKDELFQKFLRLLHNLDSNSANVCIKILFYHCMFSDMDPKILKRDFLFREINDSLFEKNMTNLHMKYPTTHFDRAYELVYSHHGLMNLSCKVYDYIRNKVFIDAGAYDGASSLVFCEYGPRKIYAFDISEQNAVLFKKNMSANKISSDQVELFSIGLGNSECDISFEDGKNGATSLEQSGTSLVHITTADNFFHDIGPVGFIKADVEGFGFKMLQGMTEILKRDRPVLSLSIYHNAEEFLEMKPYLESLNLNYNIKIVPMANFYFWEVSLLAIPNELL